MLMGKPQDAFAVARGNSRKVFGKRVRQRRKELGIGLREMARRVDISASYLSQLERGLVAPPSEKKVRAIAEVLGENANVLFELTRRIPASVVAIFRLQPEFCRKLLTLTQDFSSKERDQF